MAQSSIKIAKRIDTPPIGSADFARSLSYPPLPGTEDVDENSVTVGKESDAQ